jgi:NADP-dependent 3-hydroxy acid dehydrogenase YdfG
MNDSIVLHTQRPHSVKRGDVVLITHADTDRGYRLACRFLADGVRVVACARHATSLTRILHGHNTTEIMVIAADLDNEGQLAAVLSRAESRLGQVGVIVDGRAAPRLISACQRSFSPDAAWRGRPPNHHR